MVKNVREIYHHNYTIFSLMVKQDKMTGKLTITIKICQYNDKMEKMTGENCHHDKAITLENDFPEGQMKN